MTSPCDRCKKGYPGALPRDDIEWPDARPEPWRPGARELCVARCVRCDAWLLDLWQTDRERVGVETHEVCMVRHGQARAAVLHRDPMALAQVAPALRRKHLELLVATMPMVDQTTLKRIEDGTLATSEVFRGLVTRANAVTGSHPAIGDVQFRGRDGKAMQGVSGWRSGVELDDGSRVNLELRDGTATLSRMRADAALWRLALATEVREGFLARVQDARREEVVVMCARSSGGATLGLVDAERGDVRAVGEHELRVAAFEAKELPQDCVLLTGFGASAIVRGDGVVVWKGAAGTAAGAVASGNSVVTTDAHWRLVCVGLPHGNEHWAIPIDRGASVRAAGDGHVLLVTTDAVARLDVNETRPPRIVWMANGSHPLVMKDGGVAVVRDRWERTGRRIECVVLGDQGKRRWVLARPEATKAPIAEIGRGTLVFAAGPDVTVANAQGVTYALALPERRTPNVVIESEGVWVEYDGVMDRVDGRGMLVGRWRVA